MHKVNRLKKVEPPQGSCELHQCIIINRNYTTLPSHVPAISMQAYRAPRVTLRYLQKESSSEETFFKPFLLKGLQAPATFLHLYLSLYGLRSWVGDDLRVYYTPNPLVGIDMSFIRLEACTMVLMNPS